MRFMNAILDWIKRTTVWLPCVKCWEPMIGIVSYKTQTGRNTCWECEQIEKDNLDAVVA